MDQREATVFQKHDQIMDVTQEINQSVCYLGADPGASGAIAVIDGSTMNLTVFKWTEDRALNFEMLQKIRNCYGVIHGVVERVHSMPQQGVRSTFTFGRNYGELLMALTAAKIPFEDVTPAKWQSDLSVKKREKGKNAQHKRNLAALARQLYPNTKLTLATADAALLATWMYRKTLKTVGY